MNRFSRTAAAVAIGGVSIVSVAGVASAVTPRPVASTSPSADSSSGGTTPGARLSAIQAKAAADIARRLATLNAEIPKVTANAVITAGDKATLLATLNGDVSGLTTLGATIAADTTAKQAATDAATIFTSYRVYALAVPQVQYAAVADDITGGVLPKLTDAQTKLAALLAGADASKDTPAVQAAMTDLGTQITTATTDTTGLSATVLAFTPAQYDANHALLSGPRSQLSIARTAVKAARADIVTVMDALK